MSLQQRYELADLDRDLFERLLSLIGSGHRSLERVVIDERRQVITIDAADERAERYIGGFVSHTRRMQRKLHRKVLLETKAASLYEGDVDVELAASGDLYEIGDGLVGFRGTVLKVFRFFEDEFLAMARRYRADENHYPVMLPLGILEEIHYFTHFPNQVTFCSHMPEDLPLLDALARGISEGGGRFREEHASALLSPTHALKPAVCIPCYRQHRNRIVPRGESFAVTMQNHVFRYEGSNFRSLSRLWDFSVRDIVFFGAYETMLRLRTSVMEDTIAFCAELDLEGRVQLANDPFFIETSRSKELYQRMGEVKYELVLPLPHGKEQLAVSSFNLHRSFYTSVYNIVDDSGEAAETACMGFGLERWTYAFLSQKGLDPQKWPARVRERVFP